MGFATCCSITCAEEKIKKSTKKVPNWKMKALYPEGQGALYLLFIAKIIGGEM